jgi:hypothetical protein
VYLGEFTKKNSCAAYLLEKHGWGRMWASRVNLSLDELVDGEPVGFDNGAYGAWDKKSPMFWRNFPSKLLLRRIDGMPRIPNLAVAPDLPMAGNDSLSFSVTWRRKLPDEWPWYLAVQDGVSKELVEGNIDHFDGLFLGGSNEFKLGAEEWCNLAHRHGKKFHYGRASTYKRVREARLIGADSIDSITPVLRLVDGHTRAFTRWEQEATNRNPQMELIT